MTSNNHLKLLLSSLQVPPEYARYSNISDENVIAVLETWRENAHHQLGELRELVRQTSVVNKPLSLQEQADVVSITAPFDGEGPWISSTSREISRDILGSFTKPKVPLLTKILSDSVKPLFLSNPHPSLNLNTGRKLPRPAGGPLASQDYYESQAWKGYPGASNLVSWCVRHIESEAYEGIWHLIIPPIMTFLDDYEAFYKLRGVELVLEMLERVPQFVLKRTGVDSLLLSSLNTCLFHLQNPETPQLLRAAIDASLSLTQVATSPGSAQRFDQLCALLGDGIIGSVWLYASENLPALLASIDALPPVVRALGIGSARFLKALIPQLLHPLAPNPPSSPHVDLQVSSLRALTSVIDECSPRIHQWRRAILESVAKCWVNLVDSGAATKSSVMLRAELRHTCDRLAQACSSVIQEEYQRFLVTDSKMFEGLVGGILYNTPESPRPAGT